MNNKPPLILIEDNQDDYEAITRALRDSGFDRPIKWMNSTNQTLKFFNEILDDESKIAVIPCMILLDLNMPGIDGREMLTIIRKIEKLKATPITILTTSADKQDIIQCYESGANSYLQKPVTFDQLKELLRVYFEYWFKCAHIPNFG